MESVLYIPPPVAAMAIFLPSSVPPSGPEARGYLQKAEG